MVLTVHLVLLVISIILFAIAAIGIPADRFNIMAAGLCFFAASFLFA